MQFFSFSFFDVWYRLGTLFGFNKNHSQKFESCLDFTNNKYDIFMLNFLLFIGGKVIPKEISSSEIRSVSSVLKRKPVIWENIHANDYERSRLFLGPFKGRPVSLAKEVAGILTNPNCEYECNFVPIHTLGSWLKAVQNVSGSESNEQNTCKNKTCDGEQIYDSDLALQKAVEDWLLEITTMKKLFQKNLRNLNLDLSVLANDMNSLVSESSTCSNEVSDSESDDDIDDGISDSKKENDEKVDENQNGTLSKENDIATQKGNWLSSKLLESNLQALISCFISTASSFFTSSTKKVLTASLGRCIKYRFF